MGAVVVLVLLAVLLGIVSVSQGITWLLVVAVLLLVLGGWHGTRNR